MDSFGEISTSSDKSLPTPIQHLNSDRGHLDLSNYVELITTWYYDSYGTEEYTNAYDEFQKASGYLRSDENFFNERSSYFLDFFTFSRKISNHKANKEETPYKMFLNSDFYKDITITELAKENLISLQDHKHSIFEIIKTGSKTIIKDLLNGTKHTVKNQGSDFFTNFHRSCVLQGYIFPVEQHTRISKGIILHDQDATKYIKHLAKKAKKDSDFCEQSFVFDLAKRNLQFGRMKNLEIKKAYSI